MQRECVTSVGVARTLGREDLSVYIQRGEEGSSVLPEWAVMEPSPHTHHHLPQKFPPLATPAHAQSLRDAKSWLHSHKRRGDGGLHGHGLEWRKLHSLNRVGTIETRLKRLFSEFGDKSLQWRIWSADRSQYS